MPYDPFADPRLTLVRDVLDHTVDDRECEPLGDDLDNIMRRRAVAAYDNGVQVSELAALARARDVAKAERDAEVPYVRTTPPSAGKGVLGNSVVVTNGGPPVEVINWTADDHEEAVAFAVTLSPDQYFDGTLPGNLQLGSGQVAGLGTNLAQTLPAGTPQNRPYANVQWSSRAGMQVCQVDVGKGTVLCLSGSGVAVSVGLDAGNIAGAMRLQGSLGFGSVNRSQAPPTRTIYYDSVSLLSSKSFKVPAFARQLLPVQRTMTGAGAANTTPPTGLAFEIDFFDVNGNTVGVIYGGGTSATYMSGAMPLPDDADNFTVYDKSNSGTAYSVRLVFALGI